MDWTKNYENDIRASISFFVWTIPLRKEDQERWLSKSDNSKVGLGSAMKNTDINGLYKYEHVIILLLH